MNKQKISVVFAAVALLPAVFMMMAGGGCAIDPMVTYIGELERVRVVEKLEQLEARYINMFFTFDRSIDQMSVEDLNQYSQENDAMIENMTDLISLVENVDTSDPGVKEANDYLLEALVSMKNTINEFYVLINAGLALKEMEADLEQPDMEERIDDIIHDIEESRINTEIYLEMANEAMENWHGALKSKTEIIE